MITIPPASSMPQAAHHPHDLPCRYSLAIRQYVGALYWAVATLTTVRGEGVRVCLYVCMSVCLYVYVYVYLCSVCACVCLCLCVSLSVCAWMCGCVCVWMWELHMSPPPVCQVGYGDMTVESTAVRLYAVFMMFLGGIVYAIILSSINTVLGTVTKGVMVGVKDEIRGVKDMVGG